MTADHERVAAAIAAFKRGEIVVVTDDDDRENEGDLILAAVHATPEKLGFIVRHTSGIVCAPLPRENARRLQLQPMVADNDAPLGTAFTVSVDFRHGLTTGISAEERCNTVRALANPNAGASEFVRPGHVFPLIAQDGGVLMRSGHTEAAVDLCRLSELEPVGVLAELVNDDGTVKRGADVVSFAAEHGLKLVSVAESSASLNSRSLRTPVPPVPSLTAPPSTSPNILPSSSAISAMVAGCPFVSIARSCWKMFSAKRAASTP
jgi:3,4-dihydroxy 2-butanone 4-phosphate synthase/GTP cyclohydrolase II